MNQAERDIYFPWTKRKPETNKYRARRLQLGLTQKEFAEMVCSTASTISGIESGNRMPSRKLKARLDLVGDPLYITTEECKLVEAWRKLPINARPGVRHIMRIK